MRFPALVCILTLLLPGCGPSTGVHTRVAERAETRAGGRYVLRSEIEPGRGTLGDVIQWRLTADVPRHTMWAALLEEPPDSSLDRRELRHPALEVRGGRDVWRWSRRLQGFSLGPIPLPRAALVVDRPSGSDTIAFPLDTLFVDSLTAAARDSIQPDRGPLSPGLRSVDRFAAAAALALLAALAAVAVRGFRRRRTPRGGESDAVPPEPPGVQFSRALDSLRGEVDRLSRDAFYERLSGAIRSYIDAETGIPAPERTTREILEALAERGQAGAAARESVAGLLRRADLAKFARAEDERAGALAALDEARALIGRLAGAG